MHREKSDTTHSDPWFASLCFPNAPVISKLAFLFMKLPQKAKTAESLCQVSVSHRVAVCTLLYVHHWLQTLKLPDLWRLELIWTPSPPPHPPPPQKNKEKKKKEEAKNNNITEGACHSDYHQHCHCLSIHRRVPLPCKQPQWFCRADLQRVHNGTRGPWTCSGQCASQTHTTCTTEM